MAEAGGKVGVQEPDFLSLNKYGDGRLATLLRRSLAVMINNFIERIRFSAFQKTYVDVYKKHPEVLKSLYEQLRTQLKNICGLEVNKLCEEESVGPLLDGLDEIISEYDDEENKKPAWRPSGNPPEDMRDHIYHVKLRHKLALEKMLKKLDVRNEKILAAVQNNHEVICNMKVANREKLENFNQIFSSVNEDAEALEDCLTDHVEASVSFKH